MRYFNIQNLKNFFKVMFIHNNTFSINKIFLSTFTIILLTKLFSRLLLYNQKYSLYQLLVNYSNTGKLINTSKIKTVAEYFDMLYNDKILYLKQQTNIIIILFQMVFPYFINSKTIHNKQTNRYIKKINSSEKKRLLYYRFIVTQNILENISYLKINYFDFLFFVIVKIFINSIHLTYTWLFNPIVYYFFNTYLSNNPQQNIISHDIDTFLCFVSFFVTLVQPIYSILKQVLLHSVEKSLITFEFGSIIISVILKIIYTIFWNILLSVNINGLISLLNSCIDLSCDILITLFDVSILLLGNKKYKNMLTLFLI